MVQAIAREQCLCIEYTCNSLLKPKQAAEKAGEIP